MEPLFEINFTQKKFEQYLRVYDNYIEMRKVKPADGIFDALHPTFMDFVCRIDLLERVELIPAKGMLGTGILQFVKKGEAGKAATRLNHPFLANAFNFTQKQNETAEKICEYVRGKIAENSR